MAELKQLEFFLLRYVPDAVKEEFVNIGLLAREIGGEFGAVKITEDWSRVRCIDPEADLEVLAGLGAQLRTELLETQGWDSLLKKVQDLFSNQMQASPVKGCLAEDPAEELTTLAKLYLQGRAGMRRTIASGRQVILREMEGAFRSAGVFDLLLKRTAVAQYTKQPGDPQIYDFGYGYRDELKFLHALSLRSNPNLPSGLGSRFPKIAQDIYRETNARASLTVVVDDDLDRSQEAIGFAIGLMRENQIRVAAMGEMAGIAAEVRAELRA